MADATLAYSLLALLIAIITCAIFYLQYAFNNGNAESLPEEEAPPIRQGNRAAANRNNIRARLRARLAERNDSDSEEEVIQGGEEDVLQDSDDEEENEGILPKGKIGKKKAAKLQMKQEKKIIREREQKEREEKRELEEKRREEEKKLEQEEEEEELRKQEEERKLQEEKERREQEEYERMKTAFVVEDSGYDQNNDDKEKELLQEFVTYIKQEKVVVLEELAARFRLRTQAVINRINDLLANETLSGVMDDRGKFIYISREELEGFAKFIKQRGRVTLSELTQESGTLISLTSSA